MSYKKAKDKPQDKEIDDQIYEFLKDRLYEYVEEQEEGIDKVKSRLLYFQNYAPQERVDFYSEIISLYEYFKEKESLKEEQGEKKTFKQLHRERERNREDRLDKLVRIVQLSPKMWV